MSVELSKNFNSWGAARIPGSATMRLNEFYVKDNTGQTYELRYDPNSGTSAIVGHKTTTRARRGPGDTNTTKTETIVLFESTPEGGKFTDKGNELLNAGNLLKNDGSTFNAQDLKNTIQNDTTNAYEKTKARRQAQGVSIETKNTKVAVTGTAAGSEAASTTAENPDATPQPDAVPTNADGEKEDTVPAQNAEAKRDQTNSFLDPILEKFGIEMNTNDINRLMLKAPTEEELKRLAAEFGVSDTAIKSISQGGIKYPVDAIFGGPNSQDYVNISQYVYRPPSSNSVFGQNPLDAVTTGVQRISARAEKLGFVKLPMPNDVSDSNNVNWGEDAMNSLSAAITSAVTKDPAKVAAAAGIGALIQGLTGIQGLGKLGAMAGIFGNAGVFGEEGKNLLKNERTGMVIGSAVSSRLLSLGGVNVSPEALLARGLGVIPNQNMELLFNSPTLRTFVFNWKLAPRDEYEANKINNIIRFFKQGMAVKTTASRAGGSSLLLGTPNVFKLKFMTRDKTQLLGVGRIKECAITGCSVNYTPEGKWTAYDLGQPSSILLTLRMQELEPIYASDYINSEDGPVERTRATDFEQIRLNEVGY